MRELLGWLWAALRTERDGIGCGEFDKVANLTKVVRGPGSFQIRERETTLAKKTQESADEQELAD